jgi:hypothetical protein
MTHPEWPNYKELSETGLGNYWKNLLKVDWLLNDWTLVIIDPSILGQTQKYWIYLVTFNWTLE